ncbi:hypothetical protein MPSI1_003593 [Malassezia psittaci]|uniref:LysM domain-containing protein n=1 Tax=Malassezia psittaci TaxID=1821823 RepID=A0AAF0FDT0_9BASI|nr:hypothetical protein MPSI1_003593 [Malassezia psittaci]
MEAHAEKARTRRRVPSNSALSGVQRNSGTIHTVDRKDAMQMTDTLIDLDENRPGPSRKSSHIMTSPSYTKDSAMQREELPTSSSRSQNLQFKGRKVTTLDRLEDWLGLRTASSSQPSLRIPTPTPKNNSVQSASLHTRASASFRNYSDAPSSSAQASSSHTVDVLVHEVTPQDTIEGIALRYGADARIVRRSNRLWPGDAAQMREQIYIPIISCTWQPSDARIQLVTKHADGSMEPLNRDSASACPVARQQVDRETLGYFGAKPSTPPDAFGESGMDDLLQLQQDRRNQTHSDHPSFPLQKRPEHRATKSNPVINRPTSMDRAQQEEWRPNVWKFGAQSSRSKPSKESIPYAGKPAPRSSSHTLFDADDHETNSASDPQQAELFKDTPKKTTDVFDELLRGPVTNPGAAANWVRPIHWGESLPAVRGVASEPGTSFASLLPNLGNARHRLETFVDAAVQEFRSVSQSHSTHRPNNRQESLPM